MERLTDQELRDEALLRREQQRWLLLKLAKDIELSARLAAAHAPVVAAAHAAAADAYRLHAAAINCEAP